MRSPIDPPPEHVRLASRAAKLLASALPDAWLRVEADFEFRVKRGIVVLKALRTRMDPRFRTPWQIDREAVAKMAAQLTKIHQASGASPWRSGTLVLTRPRLGVVEADCKLLLRDNEGQRMVG